MKIEWASNFRSDGSRRRPPPSTMHGWLAKMRGTLLGDEDLRSKGMREMRDAKSFKQNKSKKIPQRKASRDKEPSALFGSLHPKPKPRPTAGQTRKPSGRSADTRSPRPRQPAPPPRRLTQPATTRRRPSQQPAPRRRHTTR
ncbi:unnamed protein product [Mycena citricolor]|uniref:Uncharacterized protein n=1 Tax=Mycena citricolor TaxID=2018698 RepID=A0AAD2JUQ1_9AGAR|nr:unnamed protein product [Mycena citricolor]CAK5275481.1 unnamed protein product [Mycena citricolor]